MKEIVMGQVWTAKDSKKFAHWVNQQGKGVTVYTIENVSRRVAPHEDAQLYSTHTFTWKHPLLGGLMTGHMCPRTLCENFGPVYETPPAGVRPMAGPGPQVAPPVDPDEIYNLDDIEIAGMEKRVDDIEQERRENATRNQRKKFSLFH